MKTKTLIVNVMDAPIPSGQEFIYTSYPTDGLYLTTNGMLVNRINSSVYGINPPVTSWGKPAADVIGVSENTLLKAIALTQKPELALELFK